MLRQLLDTTDKDRAFLFVNAPIVLVINSLGGISVLELGAITAVVARQLASEFNIRPVRVLSGTFITSLNGMGFSITILNLEANSSYDLLELLDAPAEAVGWSAPIKSEAWDTCQVTVSTGREAEQYERNRRKASQIENAANAGTYDPVRATEALVSGLRRLIRAEPEITRFDTVVGDGDCGIGLKRGAEGKKKKEHRFQACFDTDSFYSSSEIHSGPASSRKCCIGLDHHLAIGRGHNGWDFRSSLRHLPPRTSTRFPEQRPGSSNTSGLGFSTREKQ
jgi:hypothetical protein